MFKFNKNKIILLILSIAIAGSITFLQYNYFLGKQKTETVQVVIASKKIAAGDKIRDDTIASKEIPVSAFANSMIRYGAKFDNIYTKTDVEQGSYLLKNMLSVQEVPIVEEGMRKVTVNANMTMALAGRIKSGDYVDIGYIPDENQGQKEQAQIIERKIQIYNIVNSKAVNIEKIEESSGNQYDNSEKIPAAITIIVAPEQAVKIKDCEARGSLFLLGY